MAGRLCLIQRYGFIGGALPPKGDENKMLWRAFDKAVRTKPPVVAAASVVASFEFPVARMTSTPLAAMSSAPLTTTLSAPSLRALTLLCLWSA